MKKAQNRVFVVGVGMTKFMKPGRDENPDYPEMVKTSVTRALRDANISYTRVEAASVGYVFGESTSGNRALYEVGLSGIPIYNVNNNCATGSTAIHIAYSQVAGGLYDCVLAVGFEKMQKGSLPGPMFPDRTIPLDKIFIESNELIPDNPEKSAPFAAQIFGNAGMEHMKKYGTQPEHFAKIGFKNHLHSVNNPYSQFRDKYTLEQIKKAPKIYGPLTKLQCSPTSDGSAAAVIVSEDFVLKNNLQDQAVEILATALTTDSVASFGQKSFMNLAGYDMAKRAAQQVYQKTGIKPDQISVVELHDCFSANELITYEALQLCPEGKGGEFIDKGLNTYGGKVVVNPSGGLISKGHPLGATGLAQLSELCWQLRGMAEKRQVSNVQYALQHNIGLGGACYVAIYKKYNNNKGNPRPDQTSNPDELEKLENQQQPSPKL